ncbi:MAG: C4-dicarboxylate transporter DcuC [Eubacteriales bacterium]
MQILITFLILAILIFGIVKKWNTPALLFLLTLAGYFYVTAANGSVLGDETVGNAFIDIFESMNSSFMSTMSGNILIIMSLLGYITYMGALKASDMFATIVATPLQKMKQPYLLAALVILLGAVIKIAIPSAVGMVALLFATIYPVLRKCGCSNATCGSAIILSVSYVWGPADVTFVTIASLLDIKVDTAAWFVNMQIPVNLAMIAVTMVVFTLVSKYFDKKEQTIIENVDEMKVQTIKDIGVPIYYGFLPLLPIIFVLLFSSLAIKTITISIVGATFLSLFISFLVHLVSERKFTKVINTVQATFDGMATMIKSTGAILLFATTFSSMISSVGGLAQVVNAISKVMSGYGMMIVISFSGIFLLALTGTFYGNLVLITSFMKEVIMATSCNPLAAGFAAAMGMGQGAGLCPVSAAMVLTSTTSKTDLMTLIKRNIAPALSGWLTGIIILVLFYT